ncbi:MAG: choice-of-anchor J domain-containing protein, partial [candidate division WOR-3 bacterium]|nr:choice-of-anchor J domain-containing protein [candidate division WOR-3 bacterium]
MSKVKIIAGMLLVLLSMTAWAQQVEVIIGTDTTNQRAEPLDRYYNYNTHEAIYLQSEIDVAGTITHIAYYRHSGVNTDPITPVEIYMCHTTDAVVTTGSITLPPPAPFELVYSGSFPNDAGEGWREVQLTNPFYYNNTQNLRILIVKGYQQYIPSANCPLWRYTTTSPNYRTRGGRGDYSQPTSLSATYNRPNIRLKITTGPQPTYDVGVASIHSPGTTIWLRNPTTPVRALIKNYGTSAAYNFYVRCSIFGTNGVLRYSDEVLISALGANETTTVAFTNWTPNTAEVCNVVMRTVFTDDENPENDRKTRTTTVYPGGMTGGPDIGNMRWIDSDTIGGPVYNWIDISAPGFYDDTCRTGDEQRSRRIPIGFTFNFYGKPRNFFWFSTNGFISFDSLTSSYPFNASIPSTAAPNNIVAPFWDDLVTLNSWHKTFGDTMKVIQWRARTYSSPYDTIIFQAILKSNGDIIFQYNRCDATLGRGQSATVGIEDSTGTIGLQYLYNGTPFGNLLTAGRAIRFYYRPLDNDVGVVEILSPGATHTVNFQLVPQARIKNYGSLPQIFPVVCSIFGPAPNYELRYVDVKEIALASGRDTTVSFTPWIPTLPETATVKIATGLIGDERPANNIKTRLTVMRIVVDAAVTAITRPQLSELKRTIFTPQVTVVNNGSYSADVPVIAEVYQVMLYESFTGTTFPPSGWQRYNRDNGSYQWIRIRSDTTWAGGQPYTAPACAGVRYESSTLRNDDWLVTPRISIPSTGATLAFFEEGDDYWGDTLEVWVTTTGQTPTDFLNNGTRLDVFRMSLGTWGLRTYSLLPYAGQNIYIGFRYYCLDELYAKLDDITIFRNVYRDSIAVTVEPIQGNAEAYFRPCSLMNQGDYLFVAYTKLTDDMVPANNRMERTFTVTVPTLTLVSPAHGAVTTDNTPTFVWQPVFGVELYRIEVGTDSNFTNLAFSGVLGETEIESDPLTDGKYYWRVRAEYPGTPDPWSEVRQLIVNALPPVAPTPIYPEANDTISSEQITFVWSSVSDAVLYEISVGALTYQTTDTTYSLMLASGNYLWKVRACDQYGLWSEWSTEVPFTVILVAWTRLDSIPRAYDLPEGKYVKDGGALVATNNA